jgi:hypothetical protein
MTPKSKLVATIETAPPKEFPHIVAMPVEQLVEKMRLSIDGFYREGLYSENLSYMARAAVLLSEYAFSLDEQSAAKVNLIGAVRELYYAAVWHADRPVDAEGLWTAVRDAAGFTPGGSPEPADGKMIFVPAAHVAAIESTLAYLTK